MAISKFQEQAVMSCISWTPGGGMLVARTGRQYDRGAAGVEELYLVRRRSASGRWRYGLAWMAGRLSSHTTAPSADLATALRGLGLLSFRTR